MNKNEVIIAINNLRKYNTETNRIEAKTAANGFPKKCYDTFSSFSNKYGGIIIFGINEKNNFKTEGVYDVNDLQKQITNLCSDSMVPIIRPDIISMEFEGKNIVAVKIQELLQNQKPCYYKPSGIKNGSYTRVGDRDDRMTDYELYTLQSYNDHIFEDTRPNKRANIDDLNIKKLTSYIEVVKRNKPHFSKNSFNKCLKICGIIDSSKDVAYPTLAGTMIFSDYPQSFYPQLFVACVVIPGTELGDTGASGERFVDNKRVEGTIEEMLNDTMTFISRNMRTSVIFDEYGNRINKTEYPLEALREAVANALIHRDYSIQTENAYISVNMYNDRIEISNPGTLYGNNKLDKLGTSETMESRNPTIVRILEEKKSVIENRHTGIPTMKREMKKHGLPEPEFYEERDFFKVVFRNSIIKVEQNKKSGQQIDGSGQQNEVSGQQIEKSGQQIEESGQQKLSIKEYQHMILELCIEAKTAKEIKELLKIKSRQYMSSNIIKPLINEGKLEYTNKNSVNARNQKYKTKTK